MEKKIDPVEGETNSELLNATQSQKPNFYYVKHMQPGTCKYDKEVVLVDVEGMQQMIGTGAGIPIYIHHQVGVDQAEVKEKSAGYVTESFYNDLDGWSWFKVMAIDDEIRIAVANGWSASNAYAITQWGSGGTKNNVPYDREVVTAHFTHLAIVPNPRYEDACILTPEQFRAYQESRKKKLTELQNSNPDKLPSKGTNMFKLFKQKNEEVTNATEATHVEIAEGKFVTIAEARELMNGKGKKNESEVDDDAKKKAAAAETEEKENEMCDVDGEKMTMKDLKNSYRNMKKNEKKNADEKEAKEKEEKENAAKTKKNEDEAAAKKKEEDEKTNGKGYFDQLLNAHETVQDTVTVVDTGISMTARGQARYGSEALKK